MATRLNEIKNAGAKENPYTSCASGREIGACHAAECFEL